MQLRASKYSLSGRISTYAGHMHAQARMRMSWCVVAVCMVSRYRYRWAASPMIYMLLNALTHWVATLPPSGSWQAGRQLRRMKELEMLGYSQRRLRASCPSQVEKRPVKV